MPIYAYKCADCGHAFDVLQKISDAPLQECPSCHALALNKQLTAAGFQLKGNGWYATDFSGKAPAAAPAAQGEASSPAAASDAGSSADSAAASSKNSASTPASSQVSSAAPVSTPSASA